MISSLPTFIGRHTAPSHGLLLAKTRFDEIFAAQEDAARLRTAQSLTAAEGVQVATHFGEQLQLVYRRDAVCCIHENGHR
jgi:hypothetical protein